MSLETLINKGIVVVQPQTEQPQKTIIVVGVARGGTSIVAGALYHLGVPMERATSPVFEDMRLSAAFEKNSKEKFESVIKAYNEKHDTWAWKRPSTLHQLSRITRKVRNPHFIFVFRDMLSVANRNTISMNKGIQWGLQNAIDDYKKIIKFASKTKHPAVLISSEKVVKNKEEFVHALSEFCAITPSDNQLVAAQDFLTPNPTAYLQATRLGLAKGDVDLKILQTGMLTGWACYALNNGEAKVEVIVNGKPIAELVADQFNENYKKPGVHPTGHCQFEFNLKEAGVTPQDAIEVKVLNDVVNLHVDPLDLTHISDWLKQEEIEDQYEPKGGLNQNLLQTGILGGWARTNSADKMARIGIYINGDKFAEVPATIYREHLNKPNIHPTGHCGFEFNCKLHGVKPSDSIEVKVENAQLNLHTKPLVFNYLTEWLTHKQLQELNQKALNDS